MESASRGPRARGAAILVVERHPAVRSSICDLLQQGIPTCHVYEAMDEEGAISVSETAPPDAAVVDMETLSGSGLHGLRRLYEDFRRVPLIVVSNVEDEWHRQAALDAGAKGYVLKRRLGNDLVETMRRLLNGGELGRS